MNYTVLAIILVVALVLALIAWYEYQLNVVNDQLVALLDRFEEYTDLATDPPFNLQLDDPVLVEAFKLRLATDVDVEASKLDHRNAVVAEAERIFSQAEIDEWN